MCGKGSSGLSAMEAASRFMRVGVDIDSITDSDTMRFQTVFRDFNPEDVSRMEDYFERMRKNMQNELKEEL